MNPTRAQLAALRRRDPLLAGAMARVPPFPGFPQRGQYQSHFHALARSILYQQLAGKAARTIHDRVVRLTPGPRFPRAEELLGIGEEDLAAAGVSGPKRRALRDLAERCVDGRLRLAGIAKRGDEAVVEQLVAVRGIGPWSAQMFLLFRLGRLDVLAGSDLGLQEGLRRLEGWGERPSPRELEERAEVWRPLRSVASWVLWRVADGG